MLSVLKEVSLADSITILNSLFGFTAIVYAVVKDIESSLLFFYLAVLCDGFDGYIAKKTEKSRIGKELDSLADAISFGLYPALTLTFYSVQLFAFSALLLAFAILRLARFNILNLEHFLGIPTVASAVVVTAMVQLSFPEWILAFAAALLSFLMISDIKYPRLSNFFAFLAAVTIIFTILTKIYHPIFFLSLIYVAYPGVVKCGKFLQRLKLE